MNATIEKKNKTRANKKVISAIKKMLEDKRIVSEHIRKGGSLECSLPFFVSFPIFVRLQKWGSLQEELEKKGYHFATV